MIDVKKKSNNVKPGRQVVILFSETRIMFRNFEKIVFEVLPHPLYFWNYI